MRIGIRELKDQAPEIIRNVRERGEEYVVTYYGRPVAVILPVDEATVTEAEDQAAIDKARTEELLAELEALRQEISEQWQSDKSAVEIVAEQRR